MPDIFDSESQTLRDKRLLETDTPIASPEAITITPQSIPISPTTSVPNEQPVKQQSRVQLFTSFCENPENVAFQTQEPDEHILLFLRKTKLANTPWIILSVLFALLPITLFSYSSLFPHLVTTKQFLLVIIPFYYIILLTYAFVNFILWYYNAAIITDKRVIDIDFHQLVIKDIAETKLSLVQDVSYRQVGALQNLFGYGYVLIQTAGPLDNFEFYQLPQPARIVELVENLIGGRRLYE